MHAILSHEAFRLRLDAALADDLSARAERFAGILGDAELGAVVGHLRALLAGGKRVRPYVAYLGLCAHEARDVEEILPLAVGLEYFHAFCLAHDDVMDAADTRRGVATAHAFARQALDPSVGAERRARVGDAMGILLGDELFLWAQEAWTEGAVPAAARAELFAMTHEVIAGQMLDVWMTASPRAASDGRIARKMDLKTASYTFIRPIRAGLALAGRPESERAEADAFARPLGLAFQLRDDELDLFGDPAVTGKPAFGDIREGQHTHFTRALSARIAGDDAAFFASCFGRALAPEEETRLRALFEASGAREEGAAAMRAHEATAEAALAASSWSADAKTSFVAFLTRLYGRNR